MADVNHKKDPHQNFKGSYKQSQEVLDKLQDTQNIKK